MKKGAGGEGTVRDWVGKARERIGMAVGRFPNAHSEDQSLEPLCAGNTKRLAPRLVDNGPMGVQRQLNFQRARGKRCPSLSVLSNRPKRIKTHCERGRNWAIRVFTEISFRSEVRESWLKPQTWECLDSQTCPNLFQPLVPMVENHQLPAEHI